MKLHTLKQISRLLLALAIGIIFGGAVAAPILSIAPITWNVIGLDSNNVNAGPNTFPVGARVCNIGDISASAASATITLTGGTTNPYISVNGLNTVSLGSIPAGAAPPSSYSIQNVPNNCRDAYFTVVIARNTAAYSSVVSQTATPTQRNTQLYAITASATGASTVSTPTPRELFVEKIISQGRNSVQSFTGPSSVSVGQVATYTMNASTATGGYEQLENFPILPNSVFEILNISTSYTSPSGGVNSGAYADACGWENVITSINYHNNGACIGPANYSGGKAGNTMQSVYTVRIVSGGGSGVYNVIYDYSGSSYHYNSDYGNSANGFLVTATAPDLTLTKTHTGNFIVGQPGSFTFTVKTTGADAYGTTTVKDTLPTGLSLPDGAVALSGTNAASWTCSSLNSVITCTSTNGSTAALITAGNTSTFTVSGIVVGSVAAPSVTNTASVSNPNETATGNNTASDPVTVDTPPVLILSKTIAAPGRVNALDQFTVQIKNGAAVTASASTTGTGTTASSGNTTLAAGTTYTLTEILAAGSVRALSDYNTAIACTNSKAGSATALPSGAGQSFTLTPALGDVISCTLTNTAKPIISGQVFEDFNYGGGAGRAFNAASGMALRPGVRAELFNSAGTFVAAAFTDASGAYSFPGQLPGNYTVRVVNSFVTSSRGGGCAAAANVTTPPAGCTQLPVQTFVNGDVNRVGGEVPSGVDPVLSTGTLPVGAQSVAAITVGSVNVSGVDFGFNFDTVVNKNPSGQGSLGQFITNASALSNTGLAQSGSRQDFGAVQALPAGVETSIFMASGGTAVPGLRAGLPSQLTAGVLLLDQSAVSLPSVTGTNAASTSIDGTTQTVDLGNTNSGLLGTGGTVGYIVTATLGQVQRPEVEIVGAAARPYGLDLQSASDQVRGLSVRGFGNAPNSSTSANIHVGAVSGAIIEQNFAGFSAAATTLCGAGTTVASGTGDNLRFDSGTNGVVRGNIIACAAGKGIGVETASTGWLIENNEIRGNGVGNPILDGIDLENAGTASNIVRGNLITANGGVGVDSNQGGGNNLIERNTVTGNGVAQASVPGETAGVRVYSSNNTVQNNVIALNYGAGVMVTGGVSGNRISQNSIFDNGTVASAGGGAGTVTAASGQIGIDLLGTAEDISKGVAPYVTKNDAGDADTGGNGLLNFPVFLGATLQGANLVLSGYARPGSTIELFIAAADGSGFGEGKTYLTTLKEGSAQDTDAGTGMYTNVAGTDTTNRFQFSVPLSSLPGVSSGTALTATATCLAADCVGTTVAANSTSEFSYNVVANNPPVTADVTNALLLDTAAATVLSPNLAATDPDGNATIATYTIVTLPAAASGVLSVNGAAITATNTSFTAAQLATLSFDPAAGFAGNATFTYTATDNQGAVSNVSAYTLPVNVIPVAVNDTSSTPANTSKTFSVTANDTDVAPGTINVASTVFATSGQPVGAVLTNGNRTVAVPGQGSYVLDNAGNVTFTPVSGYSGTTAAVKYTVTDNQGAVSNVANITVTVTPVAVNDTANTTPSTPVNIPVLSNDVGTGKVITSLLFPATGQPASSVLSSGGKTLTNADGVYTIRPDGTVDFTPALGKTGLLSPVLYTFVDGAGQTSNPAGITVTVGSITPPTATNDSKTTPKNTAVTLAGSTNDAAGSLPIDNTSVVFPATQPAGAVVSNAGKTLTFAGQGTYQVQANGTVIFTPVSIFAGATTPVNYTVKDASGAASNAATLSVTVTNQPPVANSVTNALLTSTAPATALNPGVSGSDPDGTVVTYTVTALPSAAQGTLYCNGAAIATAPSACAPAQLSFQPNPAFNGNATFQYTVTDDNGATSNVATYTIPVNRPPVANNDTAATNPNVSVTFTVTGNDTDTAPGTVNVTSVIFDPSSTGSVTNAGKTLTVPGEGVYTANADGTVTFAPQAGFNNGASTARYTVKDNNGAVSNVATITVTVPASVDLGIVKTGPAYFRPGDALSYTLTVTNSGSAATGVTVTDTLPSGLTFATATGGGGGTYNAATGKVSWTLGTVAAGSSVVLTLTGTAPTAASVETSNGPASLTNAASTAANEAEVVTSNNSASTVSQLVYPRLSKRVRNVTTLGAFGTTGTGKPAEILEYCIDFRNYGVAVATFVISDTVPTNTNADLSGYGAGLGLQVTRGGVTTRTSTGGDTDGGSLSAAALSLDLGTLAAGESGSVCFRAGIK